MKRLAIALGVLLSSYGVVAYGGSLAALCQDSLAQNRQPDFADGGFQSLKTVQLVGSPPVLRLNTNLDVLNPNKIMLPFDQNVSVSYVYQAGGAGWAVGWMYADDLVKKGYLNASNVLVDSDGDGISDFHEDIFNLSQTRYIGQFRKCGATPPTFTWNGVKLVEPEIATDSCGSTFGTVTKSAILADGGIGNVAGWQVGKASGSTPTTPTLEFTDNGLYARIPNLLEPADPLNNAQGLGHLIFLNADDDTDTTTKPLVPVADISSKADGVPDYDVSAYDGNGRPLPAGSNPDPGVSTYDRTLNLGTLQGSREIIFYLIVFYTSQSQSPCLGRIGGVCKLWLNSPIQIFFSRPDFNMDENLSLTSPAATVDIGCGYPSTCTVDGGTYTGWLDSATLTRLASPDGGFGLVLPHEVVSVPRPTNNRMPHVIVGAPSTDPFRWILGFEDLAGGGDRDFNDVVFQINKSNGGTVTSGVVSGDISPSVASDFTITNIRFKKDDNVIYQAGGPANACAGPPKAAIDYFVAVDCNICSSGVCTPNPSPSWTKVPMPATNPAEVTFNVLDLGFTGSQLCWQARLASPNQYCQPTINSVSVGYQAVRAGLYSRSSLSTVGNSFVYGTYETPGQAWSGPWPQKEPGGSIRNYDGKPDLAIRGHLYLKSIYDPEKPAVSNPVQRWDSGGKLLNDYLTGNPSQRRLLTVNSSAKISALTTVNSAEDLLLPATQLCRVNGGKYVFDLNQDGICTSTDRDFLKDWLYGWEDNQAPNPTGVHRSWPMGGVNLSTPAVVGPPTFPAWYYTTTSDEQISYQNRFVSGVLNGSPLSARGTYTYVNTSSGMMHAFNAGQYTPATSDPCLGQNSVTLYRGYFRPSGACVSPPGITPRNYGSGAERFAFLPRSLLGRYVNNYVGPTITGAPAASLDSSPAVADVDLAGLAAGTLSWTINATVGKGAKTLLVSGEGRGQSSVFALDITQPDLDTYPIFQWEFDMSSVAGSFATAKLGNGSLLLPDTNGTRHAPVIARVDFGTSASSDCGTGKGSCRKWIAAVASDYVPGSAYAGAIYLLDLTTGLPVVVNNIPVGVIPIEQGEGIGGEPAFGDATPGDGTNDVLYVPSTSGRVFRLNLSKRDESKALGLRIPKCLVASAPLVVGGSDGPLQEIHSALVSRPGPLTESGKATVMFFFGTGDSPDDPYDATASHYYVFGYTDPDPLGTCSGAPLPPTWSNALDAGQRVWGGVSLDANFVYVTTAVGNAADACNLDNNISGKYYSFGQGDGVAQAGSGKDLGGHALNSPVIYDGHVLSVSVIGQGTAYGDASWNNKTNFTPATAPRVILWDVSTQSQLPK